VLGDESAELFQSLTIILHEVTSMTTIKRCWIILIQPNSS
jgi:hypothetical protein